MNNKKLYKSVDKKVAGVCGGIAEYFGFDATVVRLIWALVALTTGVGFVAYIVAAIIMEENPGFAGNSDVVYTNKYTSANNYSEENNNDSGEVKGFKPED